MAYYLLLDVFFKWTSILGLTPVLFWASQRQRISHIFAIKLQQLFYFIFLMLQILESFSWIRTHLGWKLDNPMAYFSLLRTLTTVLLILEFHRTLWKKGPQLREIIEQLNKSIWKLTDSRSAQEKWAFRGLGIFTCAISLTLSLVDSFEESIPDSTSYEIGGPHYFLKLRSEQAKYMLFIREGSYPRTIADAALNFSSTQFNSTDSLNTSISDISAGDAILGVFKIITKLNSTNQMFFSDLYLVLVVLSMWSSVRVFSNYVTNFLANYPRMNMPLPTLETEETSVEIFLFEPKYSSTRGRHCRQGSSAAQGHFSTDDSKHLLFDHIIEKYREIRELIRLFNETVGPQVFLYVVKSVMQYTTTLDSVFTSLAWIKKLTVIYFLLGFITILCFSADISAQMSNFKLTLCKLQNAKSSFPKKRLEVLFHELDMHPVGVSGWGTFTINYTVIFNVVTTIVTYFLIVVGNQADQHFYY